MPEATVLPDRSRPPQETPTPGDLMLPGGLNRIRQNGDFLPQKQISALLICRE